MGKNRYDPYEEEEEYNRLEYPQLQQQPSVKGGMNNNKRKGGVKKSSVKITYISSPLLMRTCDASEFRSVVQQLTGKDSTNHDHADDDDFIIIRHNNYSSNHSHKSVVQDHQDHQAAAARSWMMMQLQGGEFDADGNRASLEEHQDCFWNEVAATSSTVLQSSPCLLLV